MIVRDAELNDLPQILALVKELAEFEKEPEAVSCSLKMYEDAFNQGVFESIVLELKGEIKGMALFYMAFSTWKGKMLYLEDFIVTQDLRKQGYGQILFDAYLKKAKEKDAVLCKWQVLDWNDPAVNFYQKNAAFIEKGWWNCKIQLKQS